MAYIATELGAASKKELKIESFSQGYPTTGGAYCSSGLRINTEKFKHLSIERVKAYGSAGTLTITGYANGVGTTIDTITTGDYYVYDKEYDITSYDVVALGFRIGSPVPINSAMGGHAENIVFSN